MMIVIRARTESEGCKALAKAMGIVRLRVENSKWVPRPNRTLINWGDSQLSEFYTERCRVINKPKAVAIAANKLFFFQHVKEKVHTVPWTTEKETVKEWLSEGHQACARKILNGSGGEGLLIFEAVDKFIKAPLYTKYIKKKEEYRVHVIGDKAICIQRKALKKESELENVDHRIRNLANGYIFCRNNDVGEIPKQVIEEGVKAIACLGLDFGASDILWNEKQKQAYVLEVNTAPGLEGSTVDDYATGLRSFINGWPF